METIPVESSYLTADEIGARLRLNADTVLAWARQGRIPFVRLSPKVVRFKLADVLAALEPHHSASSDEVAP